MVDEALFDLGFLLFAALDCRECEVLGSLRSHVLFPSFRSSFCFGLAVSVRNGLGMVVGNGWASNLIRAWASVIIRIPPILSLVSYPEGGVRSISPLSFLWVISSNRPWLS